jgi:hypothetical protein
MLTLLSVFFVKRWFTLSPPALEIHHQLQAFEALHIPKHTFLLVVAGDLSLQPVHVLRPAPIIFPEGIKRTLNFFTGPPISSRNAQFLHRTLNFFTECSVFLSKTEFLHRTLNISTERLISSQNAQFLH